MTKESCDARYVSVEFLNRGLERILHETMKVKPGLLCKPQDAGYVRALEYLPREAAKMECSQSKTKKYVAVN